MTVGVLTRGDSELLDGIADAVEADDVDIAMDGDPETLLDGDPAVVVAPGEESVLDLVRAEPSVPILPVAAGPGLSSVPESGVESAVADLLAGEYETTDHPLLSASVAGERVADALLDATLVTSEPARISEYAVRTSETSVAQFRADAVVVATPAGSRGYAEAAGGPAVQPGSGVLSVVPVAPFAIDVNDWVLTGPVTLSVERDEGAVSLYADGSEVREVPPRTSVELAFDGTVELATVSVSERFFA